MASTHRKRRLSQPPSLRKQIGRKLDGIIYFCDSNIEVGGIEVARQSDGQSDAKFQKDIFKLAKCMKDMHDYIRASRNCSDVAIQSLELQGIFHTKERVQFFRMWPLGQSFLVWAKEPKKYWIAPRLSEDALTEYMGLLCRTFSCRVSLLFFLVVHKYSLLKRPLGGFACVKEPAPTSSCDGLAKFLDGVWTTSRRKAGVPRLFIVHHALQVEERIKNHLVYNFVEVFIVFFSRTMVHPA